jgi:hypothetical protein
VELCLGGYFSSKEGDFFLWVIACGFLVVLIYCFFI